MIAVTNRFNHQRSHQTGSKSERISRLETGTSARSQLIRGVAPIALPHGQKLFSRRVMYSFRASCSTSSELSRKSGECMKQSWHDFALAEPELSAIGEARL